MKPIINLTLTFCISIVSLAQNSAVDLDSLKTNLLNAEADTIKYLNSLQIARFYTSQSESDSAVKYTKMAMEIAERRSDPARSFTAYMDLGEIYRQLGDYPKSLVQYQNAFRASEKTDNIERRLYALQMIGKIYEGQGQYDLAMDHYKQGETIINKNTVGGNESFCIKQHRKRQCLSTKLRSGASLPT
jgi:tetratricopeptide (TPR) repeat protein